MLEKENELGGRICSLKSEGYNIELGALFPIVDDQEFNRQFEKSFKGLSSCQT